MLNNSVEHTKSTDVMITVSSGPTSVDCTSIQCLFRDVGLLADTFAWCSPASFLDTLPKHWEKRLSSAGADLGCTLIIVIVWSLDASEHRSWSDHGGEQVNCDTIHT